MSAPLALVATCALGLEEVVAAELSALGIAALTRERGGVSFRGDWADCYRANWRLRAANRVLVELASWAAADDAALARGAERLVLGELPLHSRLDLKEWFDPARSLAIAATASGSQLVDSRWIAQRTKDGLVDAQRRRFGRRSDVERQRPDLALRLRLAGDRATLLADSSGEPLDRRGYRSRSPVAPVREQLAAAAVLAAGWEGQGPVVDPMCGSGTLLAEAGAITLGLAPNRLRRAWAFERWPGFSAARWAAVRAEPLPAPGPQVHLYGNDLDGEALASARESLEAAGLAERATLTCGDAFALEPPPGEPGLVVVNPPYGERIAEGEAQWRRLGDLLKRRFIGFRAVVLAGGEQQGKQIGLRPRRRLPTWNGPLAMKILVFDLF